MDKKCAKLLPDGKPGCKSICGKQTDKQNCHDTQNPRQPMKQSDRCFHLISLLNPVWNINQLFVSNLLYCVNANAHISIYSKKMHFTCSWISGYKTI